MASRLPGRRLATVPSDVAATVTSPVTPSLASRGH
jgi:hypothetical protein